MSNISISRISRKSIFKKSILKYHQPVLLDEVMAGLKVRAGRRYIDATVGDGGHAMEMLKKGATVLGIDRDGDAIETAGKRLGNYVKEGKLMLVKGNFDKIGEIGEIGGGKESWDGILFDLGVRSGQLEGEGRGFSFQRDEPLDMRMDPELTVTAADLVNGLGRNELYELFTKLSQVERVRVVAEAIVRARADKLIKTTGELAGVVERVLPRRGKLHPATKVFMALRMAVNDELGSLERALPQAVGLLAPEGRLAVISFHEGEDRIVKRFFRNVSQLTEMNRKPIQAGVEEMDFNPRARSAKLRIGERNKE